MKKFLSILMAALLVFSLAIPAFADDASSISVGEKKTFKLGAGKREAIVFTPGESGAFTAEFTLISGSSVDTRIYTSYKNIRGSLSDEDGEEKQSFDFIMTANSGLEIWIINNSWSAEVSVEIKKSDAEVLNEGYNCVLADENGKCLLFTPEKSGYYNFASESGGDPYIKIYDGYYIIAENDDNGREHDLNFDCTVYLEAGESYIVFVCDYFAPDVNNILFEITFDKKEKIEELYLYSWWGDEELIETEKGTEDFVYFYVVPTGAVPDKADVKITSSNTKVVEIVDYDCSYGGICYEAKKAGTATITVEAGGVTGEIQIKVLPKCVFFFRNLLIDMVSFFTRIFSFFN